MAKINAHGARQIGPTLFTEYTRPASAHDVERIYYEAFRLRSDGVVQSRLISTRPVAEDSISHSTKHSSGYTNMALRVSNDLMKDRTKTYAEQQAPLRRWLERKGFTIVKEQW